jgi:hypothetical protein
MDRSRRILIVSKRLLTFTVATLILTVALFIVAFLFKRFPVSWFCFECGILGGFVSIQQRLKKVEDEELEYLCQSWIAILMNPIFGGLFSLVLYVLFLSGIIESPLFPRFKIPEFSCPPTVDDLRRFFAETYPALGSDFAKLAFWSFVAGFSERLVPEMIHRVTKNKQENGG